jgi:hypothetical protein
MGRRSVGGLVTLLPFIVSVGVRRLRSRAVLGLENLAVRHPTDCTFFVASGRVHRGCS